LLDFAFRQLFPCFCHTQQFSVPVRSMPQHTRARLVGCNHKYRNRVSFQRKGGREGGGMEGVRDRERPVRDTSA
jgi:hypothetical protein